jgi:hypothetical protein
MPELDISYVLLTLFSAGSILCPGSEKLVGCVLLMIGSVFEQICSSVQFHARRPWEGENKFFLHRLSFLINF